MSFNLILKVPSKEAIAIPVLGWRKLSLLGLKEVKDFPKVTYLVWGQVVDSWSLLTSALAFFLP